MLSLASLFSSYRYGSDYAAQCIRLAASVAADNRNPKYPTGFAITKTDGALYVAFDAYKMSLGFLVVITEPAQIQEMEQAIDFNINHLQVHIAEHEQANADLSHATFHGCDHLKTQFATALYSGNALPAPASQICSMHEVSFQSFCEKTLAPLQQRYNASQSALYAGIHNPTIPALLKTLKINHAAFQA